MIGSLLKACLFVIGRRKQSSQPPPLIDIRHLTHTHTHTFSLRPPPSPLRLCNQDGIKHPVESYCFWMKCFLTRQHECRETHSWGVNMPPTSQPHWENRGWSEDLLVRSAFLPSHVSSRVPFHLGLHGLFQCCEGYEVNWYVSFYLWQPPLRQTSGEPRRNGLFLILWAGLWIWMVHCDKYNSMLKNATVQWHSLIGLHKERPKISNIPSEPIALILEDVTAQ